jgi:glycosyltransferase involved in cell wall biosynthesis
MPGKPISVVHLVAGLGAGGAEKQLFLLCSYAPEDVHHTVVSIRGGGWAERLRTAGIAVHTLDEESIAGLRTIVRVALILRKLRPAILHCWLPSMSVVGALAARLSGVRHLRVIASIRNVDDWMPRWRIILQKWVARYWDLALCNSFGGFDWGIRAGLPADKLRVIPNGIERSSPRTEDEYCAARQALGLTQESFVVACANRLVPQKRMDRVVDAARQLPEYTFLVAGAGPQMDWLNTNRPDNFHLLGHMDSTRPLLAASDIFLMTSDREGTSNSLLEAMQSGCAVVATPAGDNARIMAGGAGVVTSPDRIAETIRQLLHDARSRADMGAKAAQRAWEFSTDRMV